MKKTLYLVRHATAEDLGNSPMLHDFDRELTSRGIIEAARMGKRLAEQKVAINLIISSEANRAKDTAKIFAEQLAYESENIVLDDTLYGGGARAYLPSLNGISEENSQVLMVGHNPDITFLLEYLTRSDVGVMQQAGIAMITFEGLTWAEISSKTGTLIQYFAPE